MLENSGLHRLREYRAPFNLSSNTALQSFINCPNPCKKGIKLILGDKSFQVAAPRSWNTLLSEIRAISLASDLFKGASLDVNYCSRKHLLVTPSACVSMITCVFQCQIQFLIIFYCNFICFLSVFQVFKFILGLCYVTLLVYFVVCMQIGRYNMVLCRLVATDDKAR